jgi:DNA invertase Pin-like site-specific DNA recombinase
MKKAGIYARVSTTHQHTDNQLLELRTAATRLGYTVVAELVDQGISGSKSKNDRPAFSRLHQMIQRKEVDCVMSWSICRLGRSTQDLSAFLAEVQAVGVDLYLHQQNINTATPSGRMIFGIFSALASWEREMIVERINAGLARAKSQGKKLGRPSNRNEGTAAAVKMLRSQGLGIGTIAKTLRIGVSTTSQILRAP